MQGPPYYRNVEMRDGRFVADNGIAFDISGLFDNGAYLDGRGVGMPC